MTKKDIIIYFRDLKSFKFLSQPCPKIHLLPNTFRVRKTFDELGIQNLPIKGDGPILRFPVGLKV